MPHAVILTALPVEYLTVRSHLTELQEEMHLQGTIYERGKFAANGQTWEVGIAEVGAGNAGAAIEAERAIAHFKPDILFFVGIAGGIKDVAIGDVVAATKVYGYESGKAENQFLTRPALEQSAYALVQRARSEARKEDWLQRLSSDSTSYPRVFVAPIAAGEKVIASKESDVFNFVKASYNDAIAVEMEGLGFLSAAFAYPNIKAIVVRGISDLIKDKNANDTIEGTEEERKERASCNASAFAFEILSKTLNESDRQARQQVANVITTPPYPDKWQLVLPTSAQAMDLDAASPRVFISYSHDSQEHKDRVLELANRLREDGIDCTIDQYEESPAEGWQRWMLNQVEAATFVLVACTEQYDRRFRGREAVGKGKGATWEGGMIIQELYDDQGQNSKFIPVTLTPEDANFISSPLRSATSYRLNTGDGYELLYRRLTNQPRTRKPELGKLRTLAARQRKQVFSSTSKFPIDDHQSNRSASSSSIAQPTPMWRNQVMDLQQSLKEEIAKDLQLLSQLEAKRRSEDNPRRQLQWNADIQELKQRVVERQNELKDLIHFEEPYPRATESPKSGEVLEKPKFAIITALPKEYAAVKKLLKKTEERFVPGKGAGRRYLFGEVHSIHGGKHTVVLSLADMGNNIAASRATLLLEHFPPVESIIMVGIAGGIPYPQKPDEYVRLGDIVISDRRGVVQYDFEKETITETIHRDPPRPPSAMLLEAVQLLEVERIGKNYPWLRYIEQALESGVELPPISSDVLADSSNPEQIIEHPPDPQRVKRQPRVFIAPIASANKLLKNPLKRDALRNKFGAKAVEMEGSGIADATWNHHAGYLVVRGICDYCDSNKGDAWQEYAATVAAAYTCALLESIPYQ